ncbi:MAG: MFS transporter [Anaerolineales bacterium]|nr:MFS transporter [Anaerolineales bacterium]
MGAATSLPVRDSTADRRLKLSQTILYYCGFVALGATYAALGPSLESLAKNTGADIDGISILFTARSLGYLIAAAFGSRLLDRLPAHRVIGISFLLDALLLFIFPQLQVLWGLALMMLVMGMSFSALDIGGNALLVWVHAEKVGPYMNGLHFFSGLGLFLSPVIIGQALARVDSVTPAYWLLAATFVPLAIWMLSLPSPRPPQTATEEKSGASVHPLMVFFMAAFFFLYVGAESGFGGLVFTYARTLSLSDEAGAAYLTSAYWGALMLGRLLSIPLAARLRPRYILFGNLIGSLASLGLMIFFPDSLTMLWIGSIGLGFFFSSIFPTILLWADRNISLTGQLTGRFFMGASLGGMTVPWLIGQFIDNVSAHAMMFTLLGDISLGLIVFLLLLTIAKKD